MGSCTDPKCGMTPEPRDAPSEDNTELNDMTRSLRVGAVLALPVSVIAMGADPKYGPATEFTSG
ncbi:MAG: hypothetical protein EPO42_06325 [Gallionellaceae bacterium]|nr:MAG: hypothetical protein EPO42_06325 [Gallionellaceae bacterium]